MNVSLESEQNSYECHDQDEPHVPEITDDKYSEIVGSICDQSLRFNVFQTSSRDYQINCARLPDDLTTIEEDDYLIAAKDDKEENVMMEE